MKYFLWLKQSGEGCDYTIGCGSKLLEVEAETPEAAKALFVTQVSEMINSETSFDGARLFTELMDVSDIPELANKIFMDNWHSERKEKMKQQLAYLKKELGEE